MKKIVIVTGSNGRFGKYISKKLIDNKNIIPILVTSKKIKQKYYYQLNIKKVQSIKKFLFFIKKKYGEPDILINNAAVNTTSNFNDFINNSIDEKIIETYTVNSISSLFFIKFFLKSIEKNKKKEKKVINMLTRHAIWGNKRHVDYYSSKASLYNATRSLARDYPFFTFVKTAVPETPLLFIGLISAVASIFLSHAMSVNVTIDVIIFLYKAIVVLYFILYCVYVLANANTKNTNTNVAPHGCNGSYPPGLYPPSVGVFYFSCIVTKT